jgi:hypothetical protein
MPQERYGMRIHAAPTIVHALSALGLTAPKGSGGETLALPDLNRA